MLALFHQASEQHFPWCLKAGSPRAFLAGALAAVVTMAAGHFAPARAAQLQEAAPAPDAAKSRAEAPPARNSLYFPPAEGQWEQVSPAEAGWDADKLNLALEMAGKNHSSGVVILQRGRILAERYWDLDTKGGPTDGKGRSYAWLVHGQDPTGHAIEDVASAQKSVTSILVGIAQHQGLLSLQDPVQKYLGAGWTKASPEQEKAITIRHLLTMTSGLLGNLEYEAPPGTVWRYNTAAYACALRVVAAAAKREPNDLTREWLTGRIGMTHSSWVKRAALGAENRMNSVGFATTARDLARFGLLILAGGQWQGETVIADRDYLRAALHPSQELNPSYGYLWWLNGQASAQRAAGPRANGPLIPSAPADLVAALGAADRKLYVVPSLELVATRLGTAASRSFDNDFWKCLMAAAPSRDHQSSPPGKPQ